jgi:hypothetical protein
MRQKSRKLLLAAAAVISVFVTVQPVLAQSSGVGCDGNTRLLWKGEDQSISLWKLDSGLNYLGSHVYGPYLGYFPLGITAACNNDTYVLWLGPNGLATLWQVDANLNFVTAQNYGPYLGWLPQSLSVDTTSNSTLRLIWCNISNGAVTIYYLQPNLSLVKSALYGPYPGFGSCPFVIG